MSIVTDIWDDRWLIREQRATAHGFDIILGLPAIRCRQGVTVVMTETLAAYLDGARDDPGHIVLPIGSTTIKRLRRLLGHHWRLDRVQWWEDRADHLCEMTLDEFARAHNVSTGAASHARTALFGRTLRPAGWWRETYPAGLLMSDVPRAIVAERLGISVGSVGRLRWHLWNPKTK